MALANAGTSGKGSSGGVQSVAAGDTSVVVAGTATNPTIETSDLATIAADHATAGDVAFNGHKGTGIANGAAASDVAAFGQIPTALPPNGAAGGSLAGSYPNPSVAPSGVIAATYGDASHVAQVAVAADGRVTSAASVAIPPAAVYGFFPFVAPIDPRLLSAVSTFASAPLLLGTRIVIPKSGTIHDLSVYISTSSGNIEVGIYDTAATTRNRLYTSGSVASPGTGWRIIGDPALSVTAGDEYDLVVSVKNTTISLARYVTSAGGMEQLPAGGFLTGGGTPWLSWAAAGVASVTATLAESAMAANNNVLGVMARIA